MASSGGAAAAANRPVEARMAERINSAWNRAA